AHTRQHVNLKVSKRHRFRGIDIQCGYRNGIRPNGEIEIISAAQVAKVIRNKQGCYLCRRARRTSCRCSRSRRCSCRREYGTCRWRCRRRAARSAAVAATLHLSQELEGLSYQTSYTPDRSRSVEASLVSLTIGQNQVRW